MRLIVIASLMATGWIGGLYGIAKYSEHLNTIPIENQRQALRNRIMQDFRPPEVRNALGMALGAAYNSLYQSPAYESRRRQVEKALEKYASGMDKILGIPEK